MDDEHWIAVWLPLNNPQLKPDAAARYGPFVKLAHDSLDGEHLGYFEGAIMGTVNVNLSFTLDPGADEARAVALIVEALKTCQHATEAVVACGGFVTRDGEPAHFEKAVWPPDFRGELPR